MSGRFTILATICLLIVAVVYYLDRTPEPPPRRVGLPGSATPRATAPPVTPLVLAQPAEVRKLVFHSQGRTLATERTQNGWTHTDRSGLVEDFVQDLTSLGALDRIPASEPNVLHEFGLDPPQAVLEVYVTGTAEPLRIHFGNLNPPGTNVYVRVPPSEDILLAGALLKWAFDRTLAALEPPGVHPSPTAGTARLQ